MPDASLLIDIGSTGCRARMIDDTGQTLGRAHRPIATQASGDRVEYDAEELVSTVEAVIEASAGSYAIDRAGLAIQRGSVVCWDRESRQALSPVLSWRDRRTAGAAPPMPSEVIKRMTGLRYSPYAGAPKLAWCREHLPAVQRAERDGRLVAGPLGSFLAARLTASDTPRVDATLAQRTLLWSRETGRWEPRLLEAFGLPESILPCVASGDADFGRLQRLRGRPPLTILIGDQNALPFIDGTPDPDTLYINLGTGAFLLRPLPEFIDTATFQISVLGRNRGWALEGGIHGAASALAWLEQSAGHSIPDFEAATLDAIAVPPLFLNTVDGLGSPWWQPGPPPAFVGETAAGDDPLAARLLAILESIAFLVRANVDAMNRLVRPPHRIVVAGGLSRSDVLIGRLAELLGTELLRLCAAEGTAMGLGCRLGAHALDAPAFECIPPAGPEAIEQRYQDWLEQMRDRLGD